MHKIHILSYNSLKIACTMLIFCENILIDISKNYVNKNLRDQT